MEPPSLPPVQEGPAADVFALGATLFECLTGRVPYPAESAQEAIRLRKRRRALGLSDYKGNWPDRVVEVARSMLRREPYERPTAEVLVQELTQVEADLEARNRVERLAFRLLRRRGKRAG